jgi:hypothetical protein
MLLGFPFALSIALLAALSFAPPPSADLRKKTDDLLVQLGDDDPAAFAEAAAALIKLGPDILPVLDDPARKLTELQKQRLNPVRAALREAQALRELAPKLCDFPEEPITLSSALKRLKEATGIEVSDRRSKTDEDPVLHLKLHKTGFWESIDSIAREADLKVALFHPQAGITLIDGPFVALPTSYHDIFRITVERVLAVEELATNAHALILSLELAWEPRFRPLFLQGEVQNLEVRDNQGATVQAAPGASGRVPLSRPGAAEIQIRLQAPRRSVTRLASVEGKLQLIGPGRMLTFAFDALDKKNVDKPIEQVQEGVTARLRGFSVEGDIWTASLALDYPPETPDFESFESWLVNNEAYLESKKPGGPRLNQNAGYSIDEQAGHHAAVTYRFVEENDIKLGRPADWKLVYRTPGVLVRLPVPFEFKDVPLP